MPTRRLAIACTFLILATVASRLDAQPSLIPPAQPSAPGQRDAQPPSDEPVIFGPPKGFSPDAVMNSFPPTRMGIRLADRNAITKTYRVLVLVPDEQSYFAAVSRWRVDDEGHQTRFPVLIDDGSWPAQQRIARFSRAFQPNVVLRFRDESGSWPAGGAPAERRAALESTVASIWGAAGPKPADLKARWDALGLVPPGVVSTWPTEPAWTAALALAAGRGQPLIWIEPRGNRKDDFIPLAEAEALNEAINAQVRQLGYDWETPGDELESLSLCEWLPVKVWLGAEAPKHDRHRALTDVLGRIYRIEGKKKNAYRWAWVGHISGDSASAAYDAMCALFLDWGKSGWVLDGYNNTSPWLKFDMTTTGKILERAKMEVVLDDDPYGVSLEQLRRRAAGNRLGGSGVVGATRAGMGVEAGFIAFNTKGNADFFELPPGLASPVDIPILRKPAAVYFVHSWSAFLPSSRATVAGVWRERGAFAYIGSVEEPTLAGFIPSPTVATRLTSKVPWGASVRPDLAADDPGKLAILGDPLAVMGVAPETVDGLPDLPGAVDIADTVPQALRDRDFALAIRTLGLLGRDRDAQRLMSALARTSPADLTPQVALAGIGPVFAAGDLDTLVVTAIVLLPILRDPVRVEEQGLAEIRDMVWHALWPHQSSLSPPETDLLARVLRPENILRDTEEAARAVDRIAPEVGTRRDVIERARTVTRDDNLREELRKLIR